MNAILRSITLAAALLVGAGLALAQQPTAPQPSSSIQERIAALKASLAASQAMLRQFEWVETTTVSLNGEQKSQKLERCYYGADGAIQKVPLSAPPPEKKKFGIRGAIAKSKQEEMSDYMKEAVGLVKRYVPPDQKRIQVAKEAGNVSVTPLPGQRVRLTITNYIKAGDSLAMEMSLADNTLVSARVASTMDSDNEPVTLAVTYAKLDNGASYTAQSVLDATGKELRVTIANSGYRKMAP